MGTGGDFSIVADAYLDHPTLMAPDFPDYANEPVRYDHPWTATLETLNNLFDDETGDRPCILLGYSMGGRIALQYALQYPQKLNGLVLVGATPGICDGTERAERIRKDIEQASALLNEPINSFLKTWSRQSIIHTQDRIPEPFRERMRKTRLSNNKQALAYYLTALGTGSMNPVWDQLSELRLPTLLVTGEEDKKFTNIARDMMRHLPNGTFETIPDAGHAPCFEQPLIFAEVLEKFIKERLD